MFGKTIEELLVLTKTYLRLSPKHCSILILWLFLSCLLLLSCNSTNQTLAPTVAPTLTLARVDFGSCPKVTPVEFPIAKKPRVIYALIDRSGSYGLYTKPALDILIKGLEQAIEPGDRLHLIWLGANEGPESHLVVETVPTLAPPLLTPSISTYTPTPLAASTSTPTLVPSPYKTYSVLEQQALTQSAQTLNDWLTVTADASSVIATNAAIQVARSINQQQCDQTAINNQNRILIGDWQKQREQIFEDFIHQTLDPIMDLSPQANDQGTHIYNSLFYAARTIQQEKGTNLFGAYYLIILSDMQEIGSKEGENLVVDLTDVNVLMAMVSCNQSIDCQTRTDYWEQYFKGRGSLLPTYPTRLVGETTPYVISDFLEISGGSK